MTKRLIITLLLISLMAFGGGYLLLPATTQAQTNVFHPPFPLLDSEGENVLNSGEPINTMTTCGSCHDTTFIAGHSGHVNADPSNLDWNPISYVDEMTTADWMRKYGWRHVGGGAALEVGVEMNCFLCHSGNADNATRIAALESENFIWANTATLAATGIITEDGDGWTYETDAFNELGEVLPELIALDAPEDAACGACHGVASNDKELLFDPTDTTQWHTTTSGQVFAPGRISASALNIQNKKGLSRAWDIHSERVVGCTDCHHAANNPVYSISREAGRPEHLQFDPRRMDYDEYLARPLHEFNTNTRACADCHEAVNTHTWLPYPEQHMDSLACETCHVPTLPSAALASIDWTMLNTDGEPRRTYRGLDDSNNPALIQGYMPTLLTNEQGQFAPYNIVSAWYWQADGVAVPQAALLEAFFEGDTYHTDIMAAFNTDDDNTLTEAELQLDTEDKVNAVQERLAAIGYDNAQIVATVETYPIHHSVTNGEWATRDCETCHQQDTRLAAPFVLASNVPGGVIPNIDETIRNTTLEQDANGRLLLTPNALPSSEIYIFGRDSVPLIDWIGLASLLAVTGGVALHGGLRILASRRLPHNEEHNVQNVYMYSVYERQWHWLQAAVIFGLLFSGLIIHKPALFPLLQFRVLVLLHNALAIILIINAALAMFYHLASGEIKQYLPQPRGYFNDFILQARYYAWGIFNGAPHPLEKTPERKLNPIQQITYLGLLNVLLPLQVITGTLMWLIGRYPETINSLGGLPLLAPFHTLISWLMASFIVVHVYMTTTGHTPLANIRAMMMGWDEVEVHGETAPGD